MKTGIALLTILFCLPLYAFAGENQFRFVKAENRGEAARTFTYECLETGILVEMQQRYNETLKCEEVKFAGISMCDIWSSDITPPDRFAELVNRACFNTKRMQAKVTP